MRKIILIILPAVLLLTAGCTLSLPGCEKPDTSGGIFRSDDGGKSWTQKVYFNEEHNLGAVDILDLEMDPKNPDLLYAGSAGHGLFVSKNSADNWEKVTDENNLFHSQASIYDITIDSNNSDRLYVASLFGSRSKIFKSEDKGKTWQDIYTEPQIEHYITQIKVNPINSNLLYAGSTTGGFLRSEDGGENWILTKWLKAQVSKIIFSPYNHNEVYIYLGGDENIIIKTYDKGETWKSLNLSEVKGSIDEFYISSSVKGLMYLTTSYSLYESRDSGKTWEIINNPIAPGAISIRSFAQDPRNPQILYFTASSSVYKSKDYGQSWTVYKIGTKGYIGKFIIDPKDSNIIYSVVKLPPKKGLFS